MTELTRRLLSREAFDNLVLDLPPRDAKLLNEHDIGWRSGWQRLVYAHGAEIAALRARADAAERGQCSHAIHNEDALKAERDEWLAAHNRAVAAYNSTLADRDEWKHAADAAELRATYHEHMVEQERAEVTRLERVIEGAAPVLRGADELDANGFDPFSVHGFRQILDQWRLDGCPGVEAAHPPASAKV
jgi:hypothetical protein